MIKRAMRAVSRFIAPVLPPERVVSGLWNYPRFISEWRRYGQLSGAEPLHLVDAMPQLHDRTSSSTIDAHYFFVNGWAMRRIVAQQPAEHMDIGSQTMFVNLLSAVLPVTFVDYRPLQQSLPGLTNRGGDILQLPLPTGTIHSLSCLHVAEHIGLGRYGDALNPHGTQQACAELQRILAPGGMLYFALPVGKPRVCFNAHRIHAPQTILDYFGELELVEFSGVDDAGRYLDKVEPATLAPSRYACGLFMFHKPRA
jgi:hypothetical protein